MMNLYKRYFLLVALAGGLLVTGCKVPALVQAPASLPAPAAFESTTDTTNTALVSWRQFFTDPYLVALIDTALARNQELAITLQEVEQAKNDIRVRKGQLLPFVDAGVGVGMEKVGRYTSQGAGDASADIIPGKRVPEWLGEYQPALAADWEADIWHKLHNAKKAAVDRYLATVEGKNFLVTNLVAELAGNYYELLALDNQLQIVDETINLQQNALEVLRVQKQAAVVTELAVKKFAAEVLNGQSMKYDIRQQITERENTLNFLLGRYPQAIARDTTGILQLDPASVAAGLPSQLLANRPDIRQAEWTLQAAKLDVQVARAEFFPSFRISAVLGFQAFRPDYLVRFPESLLASAAGDLAGPLINRNAIKAEYANANARQIQAVYNYERTVLNGYIEVSTELSNIGNLQQEYALKLHQVDTLKASVDISGDLFRAARADYLEVLLTQRDALAAQLELTETRLRQFNAVTHLYRALGGGWR